MGAGLSDDRAERNRSSAPCEVLRRLREAHEECDGDFCTLEKRTLLALLDVAEAAAAMSDEPQTLGGLQRVRAALARLGEEGR